MVFFPPAVPKTYRTKCVPLLYTQGSNRQDFSGNKSISYRHIPQNDITLHHLSTCHKNIITCNKQQ